LVVEAAVVNTMHILRVMALMAGAMESQGLQRRLGAEQRIPEVEVEVEAIPMLSKVVAVMVVQALSSSDSHQ
jgi:hypothetical protein